MNLLPHRAPPPPAPPECPACHTPLLAGRFVCDGCWEAVPKGVRSRLWDAWQSWTDNYGDPAARAYYDNAIADLVNAAIAAHHPVPAEQKTD